MPRVKFLEDFEYKPLPQQTYAYKKGDVVLVTQEIAEKAIGAMKAEVTDFPVPASGIKETISKFKNTRKRNNKTVEEVIED